jgi:outer membrane protein
MNKILLALNAFLVLAVAFLFYKVNSIGGSSSDNETKKEITENKTEDSTKTTSKIDVINVATPPTGKIAFINIDVINEQSLEIADLVNELKRSKSNIEASVQSLSMQYQKKMQEYEASAKAGIAPQSELEAKGREIQAIEKEAQNKQLQMDNLSMTMNEKNGAFQQGLKAFLVKWNDGRYDYILTYSDAVPTLLLGNASLDITKEVIEKVNAEYKSKKEQSKSKK